MMEDAETSAWLELPDGARVAIERTCTLGRSSSNQVVLQDDGVSRRHAIVHAQGENEFWLVDLGSGNGTYLQGKRVSQPKQLRDGELIQISGFIITFRLSTPGAHPPGHGTSSKNTVIQVRSTPCWLLVTDIESSTSLARDMSADDLPVLIGRWFSACKLAIEDCGGTINKYLGDGFFAYWEENDDSIASVTKAIRELRTLQEKKSPPFRMVLHYGKVRMGGGPSLGEESLSGLQVNFVFRMEKLAGALGQSYLASEAAQDQSMLGQPTVQAGRHSIPGFAGDFLFFRA